MADHLQPPSRTWTFCGGSEHWLQLASASGTSHAFPVPLAPLLRPQRRAMETVILGAKRRGFRWGFVVGDFLGTWTTGFLGGVRKGWWWGAYTVYYCIQLYIYNYIELNRININIKLNVDVIFLEGVIMSRFGSSFPLVDRWRDDMWKV